MEEKIFSPQNWEQLISSERRRMLPVSLFLDLVKPKTDEIWADLGCGPGYFTLPIAEKVRKVYAIDISEEMLKICKKRASERNLKNIVYIQVKGSYHKFDSDMFDAVILANVYHEFDERQKIILEIKRTLKKFGFVYLIDWKYEKMDFGPPLEHRMPVEDVIKEFTEVGYKLKIQSSIYPYNYMLAFTKTAI